MVSGIQWAKTAEHPSELQRAGALQNLKEHSLRALSIMSPELAQHFPGFIDLQELHTITVTHTYPGTILPGCVTLGKLLNLSEPVS